MIPTRATFNAHGRHDGEAPKLERVFDRLNMKYVPTDARGTETRRRKPKGWTEDDEARQLYRAVTWLLVMASAPLIVFYAYYYFPDFFQMLMSK